MIEFNKTVNQPNQYKMRGCQKQIVCLNILLILVQFLDPANAEGSGEEETSVSNDYYLDLSNCNECNHPTDQADISVLENDGCTFENDDPKSCQTFYKKCLAICHKQETEYLEALESYFENMSIPKKNKLKKLMNAQFSVIENSLTMKKYIHDCAEEKLGLNYTNLPFAWEKGGAGSTCKNNTDILDTMLVANSHCRPVWHNLRVRMEFYQNCLKSYNIRDFKRKGVSASRTLQGLAHELHKVEKQRANNQIGGGAAMIAGGIMAGIGVLLTPFTGGASLALTASAFTLGGTAISLSGSIATFFGNDPAKFVNDAAMEMKELKEDGNAIATLLLLYMVSHDDLDKFINENPKYNKLMLKLEKDIGMKSTLDAARNINAISQSASFFLKTNRKNVAILSKKVLPTKVFLKASKGFQTSLAPIQNAISSKLTVFRGDIMKRGSAAVSEKLVPKLFRNSKAVNFLKNFKKVPRIPLLVSGLSVGIGIWEVFEGKRKLKFGMHHHVKLASRQTIAGIDDVVDAYVKTMNAGNIDDIPVVSDNKEEELYVAYIHVANGNWDYLSGMYLQFESNGVRCKTSTKYGISTGWHEFDDRELLGQCYRHKIVNENLTVSVTSVQNSHIEDIITIDMIEVATDGRFLPTFKTVNHTTQMSPANDTSKSNYTSTTQNPVRNISQALSASELRQSNQVKLYPIRNRLTKMKVHTSTESYSGTDSDIACRIEYIVPGDGNILEEKKYSTEIKLDNPEVDDRERDQSDVYRGDIIAKLGLDDILDSRPLGALSGQPQEDESLRISFKNEGNGLGPDWNVDLIKLYFIGTKGQEVNFVCHTGSQWIASNNEWVPFECRMYRPENPLISLEQMKLSVCDKTYAGSSSSQVRLHLCRNGRDFSPSPYGNFTDAEDRGKCCRTNYFSAIYNRGGITTVDGHTNKDDGGEKLGQCEGYEITNGSFSTIVENKGGDAVCFENIEFYGKSEDSLASSIYPIPFRTCSLPSLWAESQKVTIDEHGDCTWRPYNDPRSLATCSLDSTINLSFLKVGICNSWDAASADPFTITICDSNQENCCETDELNTQSLFNSYGDYKKEIWTAKLGTCYNKTMKNDLLISVNLPGSDGLCVNYFQFGEKSGDAVNNKTVSTCEFSNIHVDSSQTQICKRAIDYKKVPIQCPGNVGMTIKRIAMKVSDERNAGSSNNVTIVMRNSNGNKCETSPIPDPLAGHYIEYSNIGHECQKLQIADYVDVWVSTIEGTDDLYLTHFYLDVGDEMGVTKQMACLLNQQEEFFVAVNGDETKFGVPLKCK